MHYVELHFKNAALPMTMGQCKDYVTDNEIVRLGLGCVNRADWERTKDSILYINTKEDRNALGDKIIRFEPISNMLHTLCGVRPVPTFKSTLRKRLDVIDAMAKEGYYKLSNTVILKTEDGTCRPVLDVTTARKYVPNSNRKDLTTISKKGVVYKGLVNWSTFRLHYKYTRENDYNLIHGKFKEWYGKDGYEQEHTLVDFLVYLAEDKGLKEEMKEFFSSKELYTMCGNFLKVIEGNQTDLGSFNSIPGITMNNRNYNLARRPTNSSPLFKMYLSGTFIIPVEDDNIYEEILKGNRVTNYLDGGIVEYVRSYRSIDSINLIGFNNIA